MKLFLSAIALLTTVAAIVTATPAVAGELQARNIKVNSNTNSSQSTVKPALVAQTPPDSLTKPKKKYYVAPSISFGQKIEASFGGQTIPGTGATLTAYGVTGKIEVADNISVRPFFTFGSGSSPTIAVAGFTGSVNYSSTTYGVSGTYDYKIPNSDFTPYGGAGFYSNSVNTSVTPNILGVGTNSQSGLYLEAGVDYQVSDSIIINANYKSVNGLGIAVGYGF
jgi:opacity protein-like surface antigen